MGALHLLRLTSGLLLSIAYWYCIEWRVPGVANGRHRAPHAAAPARASPVCAVHFIESGGETSNVMRDPDRTRLTCRLRTLRYVTKIILEISEYDLTLRKG